GMSLPPDEDWVNLTYTDGTKTYDSRFDWEVIDAFDRVALLAGLPSEGAGAAAAAAAMLLGLDLNRMLLDRVRKFVFDPQAVLGGEEATTPLQKATTAAATTAAAAAATALAAPPPAPPRAETSIFPDVFPRFGEVSTPSGPVGYIRLKSFAPRSMDVNG